MKKFISMALAAAMIASMSVPAFAFSVETVGDHANNPDVNDVRIAKSLVHRGHNDGVRILFFPFEVKGGGNAVRPIYGGVNVKDDVGAAGVSNEEFLTDGKVIPYHFSQIEDFDELTWTVKFDEDCKQYLRAVEQIHDCPTFIRIKHRNINGTGNSKADDTAEYVDIDGDTVADDVWGDKLGTAEKNQHWMNRWDLELEGNRDLGIYSAAEEQTHKYGGNANLLYSEMEGLKVVLNENTTTETVRISGTVKLKHKGKELDEYDFSYNYKNNGVEVTDAGFDYGNGSEGVITVIDNGRYEVVPLYEYENLIDDFASEINDETATIDLRGTARSVTVIDFGKDVEEIELEDHNGFYYTVKASDQGKVNLSYENGIQYSNMWLAQNYMGKEIIPAGSDTHWFNFKARPEFDFTGEVTIDIPDQDREWFLYTVDPNTCQYAPVKHAVLSDDGDSFEFKTRVLECYLLTDVALPDLAALAAQAEAPAAEEEAVVVNPSTGGEEA